MVYAEICSKDYERGFILVSEGIEDLAKDLFQIMKDEDITDFLPAPLYDRDTQKKLCTLEFVDKKQIILNPV